MTDAFRTDVRPGARAVLSLLARNPSFARLYAAQLVSFGGDWFAQVALAGLVYQLTRSAALVTLILVTHMLSIAVFSPIGGHLADRLDRRRLMVAADLIRMVLALGFLLVDRPDQVWLVYVLAAGIGGLTAVFEPTSSAAVPNLVDPDDLPAANVLVGSAWGTMLAVGGALGGIVAATLGRDAAFIGDAATFGVSAVLLVGIRRRFAEQRTGEHPGIAEAVVETVRYARRDHRVLALLSVKGGFGLAGGVIGLLPLLALTVYDAGDRGTGILLAARGLGALTGPFLARRFTRDLRSLFLAIGASFAVFGVSYAMVPLAGGLWMAAVFVLAGHLGGGAQWTLSTYGLQRIVPDRIRGRVFSFDFGLVTLTMAGSILLAGWAADRFGVRPVVTIVALVALAWAVVWSALTTSIRREHRETERPALAASVR
ncbi:MAG TPA: MFS transporter [Actinomycetota bacterium]|nr:MFS transporter [Actinomycetota bacterium]